MISISDLKIEPFKKEWVSIEKTNCYAYALGLDINYDDLGIEGYEPGFTYKEKLPLHFNGDDLINNVVKDLDNLEIDFRHVNSCYKLCSGEWRIAIFGGYRFTDVKFDDFHFMKQTVDGIWIHKPGYYGKPTNLKDISPRESYIDDYVLYHHIITLCLRKKG